MRNNFEHHESEFWEIKRLNEFKSTFLQVSIFVLLAMESVIGRIFCAAIRSP